jgi:TorA maturation chaperone TorD
VTALAPEDAARADFYALLARLWHSGPDAPLLAAIAAADEIAAEGDQTGLADAWRQLQAAAAAADAETARTEHDALFVGTGRAAVTPYASHYLTETARERLLVALRDELVELGLEPRCSKSCGIWSRPAHRMLRCSDRRTSSLAICTALTIRLPTT